MALTSSSRRHGPPSTATERDPHPRGAGLRRRPAAASSPPRRDELLAARAVNARRGVAAPAGSTSCPRPRTIRDGDWTVAPAPADLRRPAGRDHRADRPQDDDQRAELRRQGLAGRPRGREHPALAQRGRRPGQPVRRGPAAPSPSRTAEGKDYALRDRRAAGHHRDPPARLALRRAAPAGRRRTRSSARWSTSACTSSTTPRSCSTRGSGPYFYLPKMESHLEARLWNDVFTFAQERLGIPHGTIRATVLIETIPAAFEMDEILYELRDHASGLNAGRWDYLFSIIKYFRDAGPTFVLPDRAAVDDDRAVHAGLHRAAGPDLPPARRLRDRRDGRVHPEPPRPGGQRASPSPRSARTRSARPATASTAPGSPTPTWCRSAARSSTRCSATGPNQLDRQRDDVTVTADDLLDVASDAGRDHRGRAARQRQRRAAVPGGVAARQRRGRASTT